MNVKEAYKPIHASVTDPARDNIFFKGKKNERAKCTVIKCCNKDNCLLFKRSQCALLALTFLSPVGCPYGRKSIEEGFTGRAGQYKKWINQKKEQYQDVLNKLNDYEHMIAEVGDYVFLPYRYMNLDTNYKHPFLKSSGFGRVGSYFMPKEQFTKERIIAIIEAKPQALFGGEIKDYQEKVVPVFVKHLQEVMPLTFNAVATEYPQVHEILNRYTCVGRKAYLRSLRPGVVVTKNEDTHNLKTEHWEWDGEFLTSDDADLSFPVVPFTECFIKLKPKEDVHISITNDDQVDENTQFVT